MADNYNNINEIWDKLPKNPYPELRKLDRLVGRWKISAGPKVEEYTVFEWMEGGFFLIQRFDLTDEREQHKVSNILVLTKILKHCAHI